MNKDSGKLSKEMAELEAGIKKGLTQRQVNARPGSPSDKGEDKKVDSK